MFSNLYQELTLGLKHGLQGWTLFYQMCILAAQPVARGFGIWVILGLFGGFRGQGAEDRV